MDKAYILWLLGVAQMLIFIGGGFLIKAYISFSTRLTRLEIFMSMINKQAAEILHSPHTPELDILLEKLVASYDNGHNDMSQEEWTKLQEMTQGIKEDLTEPKGTRLLAAMIYSLSCHKLSRWGKKLPL